VLHQIDRLAGQAMEVKQHQNLGMFFQTPQPFRPFRVEDNAGLKPADQTGLKQIVAGIFNIADWLNSESRF
jgi:hypothetical protein